jgi:hypothetical protein
MPRERCPKGTRKNNKTGNCDPPIQTNVEIHQTNTTLQGAILEKKTIHRCPKGTRKNKKTGNCESVVEPSLIGQIANSIETLFSEGVTKQPVQETRQIDRNLPIDKTTTNEITEKIFEPFQEENKEIREPDEMKIHKNVDIDEIIEKQVSKIKKKKLNIVIKPKTVVTETDISKIPLENKNVMNWKDYQMPEDVKTELEKEKYEYDLEQDLEENTGNIIETTNKSYDYLYPDLNDPRFNEKISKRKEFFETQYDGKIVDIKTRANQLCKMEFELMPHQIFVKNFLSFQTPYNSLLLYHGLGSGKTCSAIGITEEMRSYMKQIGMKQRIIIVASPEVQKNFQLQLFDERKLQFVNGLWKMNSCTGNSLLNEINPTRLQQITNKSIQEQRQYISKQIISLINSYYIFFGYFEFSNYIEKKTAIDDATIPEKERKIKEKQRIQTVFNNRFIVIDEIHNIRITNDNANKPVAISLMKLAKYTSNMRLLLLSATPMYNSPKEIVWLANLMNTNDKRAPIQTDDVFDKMGNFLPERMIRNEKGGEIKVESGKDLLRRKLIGYVSYVRGENPYLFPFRIYPDLFAKDKTITETFEYPKLQMNSKPISEPLKYISVYLNPVVNYQSAGYKYILDYMTKQNYSIYTSVGTLREMPNFEEMDSFSYNKLQIPLQALNIIYPSSQFVPPFSVTEKVEGHSQVENLEEQKKREVIISTMVGKSGLLNVMNVTEKGFSYKPDVLKTYGRIFNEENLWKYSSKIANICKIIMKSKGIVLIYSEYIDGGLVPIALALEEMGFSKYNEQSTEKNLFETKPTITNQTVTTNSSKYAMITGDKKYSTNNSAILKYLTGQKNVRGELVKVVLISRTGAEGLDFKNIRQIHIMDPWYNMNRMEQIIGRGVRNLSHCQLPFEERNVEIYLHASTCDDNKETADLYLYRLAEKKAVQIGKVTRLLKENAIDCQLNMGQNNFTLEKMMELSQNQTIEIETSSKTEKIQFIVGDKPFTNICDYMETCNYQCSPSSRKITEKDVIEDTYHETFTKTNHAHITDRILHLFREQSIYKNDVLIDSINITKQYPIDQIYSTITYLIKNKNENIVDKYGRLGNIVNKGNYYAFQPLEINNENASIYERSVPIDYNEGSVFLELSKKKNEMMEDEDEDEIVVEENPIEIQNEKSIVMGNEIVNSRYTNIKRGIIENLILSGNTKKITGETNWYKHTGIILSHLEEKYNIHSKLAKKYIVEHCIDILSFEDKKILFENTDLHMKYTDTTDILIQQYLMTAVITSTDNKVGTVFVKEQVWKIYIAPEPSSNSKKWVEAETEDYAKFKDSLFKMYYKEPKLFNPVVGFTAIFNNKEMVFKIKDITQKRNNVGARIDSAGKSDIIKKLNEIVGEPYYTQENTSIYQKYSLCSVLEILLRHFNDTRKNGKSWYFTPEQTVFNSIIKV